MTDVEKRREFMTTWHDSPRPWLEAWSDRDKAGLMHRARSTRHIPLFRPFDLLARPNQSLVLLENDDHRIGVDSVCGAQPDFRRHVDFDTVYFQFSGRTSIETEFGEYAMAPGDLMFIPEGISHRATGTADSLRWFAYVSDPFIEFQTEENHTSHTEFAVIRHGGPSWTIPTGAAAPRKEGRIIERMICWRDGPDDSTTVERDYDFLAGATSTQIKEKVSGIRRLRAFDVFKGIAGVKGGVDAIFRAPHLEVKTYNVMGEQFAFHRALRSEEVRIQFRGVAMDMSEIENVTMRPGDVTVIPRGIAHSVITDPPDDESFLRLNFYSNLQWRTPNDLTKYAFNSSFEVKTVVHRKAAWQTAAE